VIAIRITDAKQIAGVIGDLRVMSRLSYRALAGEAECNNGQVHTWLSGERTPNAASLIRLANALGYDLALIPKERP
jgi:transcriptional regulator with XRE-family HTH domain